jgi:hypothetical protein
MNHHDVAQLLIRHNPVQGHTGAAIAMSELRRGGDKRFRSLALRFEIPPASLARIEAALGGEGVADYRDIIVRALDA